MRAVSLAVISILVVFAATAQEAPTAGRIEGTIRTGGTSQAGQTVLLVEQGGSAGNVSQQKSITDAAGHYTFDQVPEGRYIVGVMGQINMRTPNGVMPMWSLANARGALAKAGEVSVVDIGGNGRKLVGRLAAPADNKSEIEYLGGSRRRLTRDVPFPNPPEGMAGAEQAAWAQKITQSDEWKALWPQTAMFLIDVAEDGSFSVNDVPPGNYDLAIEVGEKNSQDRAPAGMAIAKVVVPEGPAEQPVDAGTITLKMSPRIKEGDPAPDFSVPGADGKQVSLSDYKGKYVLLDFWASWCGPCRIEMPNVKAVYEKFGQNAKFAIIGLSLDHTPEAAKEYIESNGMKWTQGLLGPWKKTNVPSSYGVNGIPAMFLIGPDGKFAAVGLRGDAIMETVEKALK
jgi:peroxiredoxin